MLHLEGFTKPRVNGAHSSLRVPSFGPACLVLLAAFVLIDTATAETWRGLIAAPEHRCSPHDGKRGHPYLQSIERRIAHRPGAVYGPCTGTCFAATGETDIGYIVAAGEVHESGFRARDPVTSARFARDLRKLVLATPHVNRQRRTGRDATEWLPVRNRCGFGARVVEVRRVYDLTMDRRGSTALVRIFPGADPSPVREHRDGTADVPYRTISGQRADTSPDDGGDALARYDDDRNGRITCKEAHHHGIAPVPNTHPAYEYMHDADNDGVVCERYKRHKGQ